MRGQIRGPGGVRGRVREGDEKMKLQGGYTFPSGVGDDRPELPGSILNKPTRGCVLKLTTRVRRRLRCDAREGVARTALRDASGVIRTRAERSGSDTRATH